MSKPDDSSLFSFYFLSQSSQKKPKQKGIEDHQAEMTDPERGFDSLPIDRFIPENPNYGIDGEDETKAQKEDLYQI